MIKSVLKEYKTSIDAYLEKVFSDRGYDYSKVIDAMAYSVAAGGKRIRPVLTLEFARIANSNIEKMMPLACAVELIHTYSLIHDDLPCLDNDDVRRGQPSCHKQFDEATALLAGDALLTMAFDLIANSDVDDKNKVEAIKILSKNAGIHGMIGGQVLDIAHEGQSVTQKQLDNINLLKTSALIEAACLIGCVESDDGKLIDTAKTYARNVGLAFQITDDILDITSSVEQLGKPIGSDADNKKDTYVSILGIPKCKKIVEDLTNEACAKLEDIEGDTQFLSELARYLCDRNN